MLWVGALVLLTLCLAAQAHIRLVKKGKVPLLAPDEGLLVVGVDSSQAFNTMHIARQGHAFGGETLVDVPAGRSLKLYAVTAGDYRWDRIEETFWVLRYYFDLRDDPGMHFVVKPGVINYAGDFLFRRYDGRARIHLTNRGLQAMEWLRATHPQVSSKYRFAYSGRYPDPFPDFYAAERAGKPEMTDAQLARTLPPPAQGKLPIPVEDLWHRPRIYDVSLNPRGDLLAEVIREKDHWSVDVIDLQAERQTLLLGNLPKPGTLRWNGDQVLLVASEHPDTVEVVRIGAAGSAGRAHVAFRIPMVGRVIAGVPGDPDHVLFESAWKDGMQVHRLDISGPDAFVHQQFSRSRHVDRGVDDALGWDADGEGRLRLAFVRRGNHPTLLYGDGTTFRPVMQLDGDDPFKPLMLSADGSLIYGLTDQGRAQRELVEMDPATGKIVKTVFAKPGRDVETVKTDGHRNVVGATWFENGQLTATYFDQQDNRIQQQLAQAFPGMAVNIIDRDDAGRHFIVAVQSSDHPLRLYHFDLAHATAELLEESAPALANRTLAPARVVHAAGSDGTPIEAYLTLPLHPAGKSPLIVYSHGGPIGIRDDVTFDPAVQLFASLGYAVLQVNFRGSEGYGRAFREAGRHHYGGLIEDDIDAATRLVLAQFPIDPHRLCAVGASYGGFSALISAIRWPQRFRCVVSISGVSDHLLMFTASDTAWTEDGRAALVRAIGDPATDVPKMREYSPLYRYRELTVPVFLAHGTEDFRVDYEHSLRLIRLLNLAGHTPVMLTLEGEGHGNSLEKDDDTLWNGVAGFLREQLGDPKSGERDAGEITPAVPASAGAGRSPAMRPATVEGSHAQAPQPP